MGAVAAHPVFQAHPTAVTSFHTIMVRWLRLDVTAPVAGSPLNVSGHSLTHMSMNPDAL